MLLHLNVDGNTCSIYIYKQKAKKKIYKYLFDINVWNAEKEKKKQSRGANKTIHIKV